MTSDDAERRLDQLRSALVKVQSDLSTSLPEWSGMQILVVPEDWGGQYDEVAIVADSYGAYVAGTPLYGPTPIAALFSVADSVQELLADIYWVVWPICQQHHCGVHVRPSGHGAEWDPHVLNAWPEAAPAWWCRGDGGHDLALVGELAGKRRTRRPDRRPRAPRKYR